MNSKYGLVFILIFVYPGKVIAADINQPSLEVKLNSRYVIDKGLAVASKVNPVPKMSQYEQSGIGLELNFKSPYYDDIIGFDASAYGAVKLADSGNPTIQLFDVKPNGKVDKGFSNLGILAVKAKLDEGNEIRVGRQLVNTMFIKSTFNRAVPDTFSGISATLQPTKNLGLYGGYYNKWLPRTAETFSNFTTDNYEKINYIALFGSKYQNSQWTVNTEYLNSADYLKKYGFIAGYKLPLKTSNLNFRFGGLFSKDAGHLFKCGAESDLDCIKNKPIHNHGNGYFLETTWQKNNLAVTAALTKINDFWIEDNYSTKSLRNNVLIQDNGTNPFPTASTLGPDFTNRGETVWMARIKYDWKDYFEGLSTDYKYTSGHGAHQSNIMSDIRGKEKGSELGINYQIPYINSLNFRYSYVTYTSDLVRNDLSKINGMTRANWHQQRIALNYSHQF